MEDAATTAALRLLQHSIASQPAPSAQRRPRPLRVEERALVQKQATDSSWDENTIGGFLKTGGVTAAAVDLRGGGKLLFVTQDHRELASIASQTDALFAWLGTPPGFTLILFWRDDPRNIREDEWPSRRSVNGGYTYAGSNTIIVYRQEEWDRVLLHEAIHALRWDWDVPPTPMPCWGLSADSQLSPHLFEAWTELYAEWLWCGWHNKSWSAQKDWMRVQAVQILARNSTSSASWRENTNIFAYYVLKAALAPHFAFLWSLQRSMDASTRSYVLCDMIAGDLAGLRRDAVSTRPQSVSMRMTRP
jgi:hypothetical protein